MVALSERVKALLDDRASHGSLHGCGQGTRPWYGKDDDCCQEGDENISRSAQEYCIYCTGMGRDCLTVNVLLVGSVVMSGSLH